METTYQTCYLAALVRRDVMGAEMVVDLRQADTCWPTKEDWNGPHRKVVQATHQDMYVVSYRWLKDSRHVGYAKDPWRYR